MKGGILVGVGVRVKVRAGAGAGAGARAGARVRVRVRVRARARAWAWAWARVREVPMYQLTKLPHLLTCRSATTAMRLKRISFVEYFSMRFWIIGRTWSGSALGVGSGLGSGARVRVRASWSTDRCASRSKAAPTWLVS